MYVLDEEFHDLQLDVPKNGKSTEQMRKHTIDPDLEEKPVDKTLYLLRLIVKNVIIKFRFSCKKMDLFFINNNQYSVVDDEYVQLQEIYMKGDEVQKLCVVQTLPTLLSYDPESTVRRILPKVLQELSSASAEFHIVSSKVFRILMENRALHKDLLYPILRYLESKDLVISFAWVDTLLAVIPMLSEEHVKKEILPLAVTKSHLNYPVQWRMTSCKILGKVAVHPNVQSLDVKTNILPLVQSLCQDCFQEVRAAMCAQLHLIAQGLGDNSVVSSLLPSLVELASDEHMAVRSSAVSAVVLIVPYLSNKTKSDTIVPLFKQLCERSVIRGDVTYLTVSKEFGHLLHGLQGILSTENGAWFLQFYKELCQKQPSIMINATQAAQCRDNCAYNLPAVTVFSVNEMPKMLNIWHITFSHLANDPCYFVRRTVASCLHEICGLLCPQSRLIVEDFVKLLRDDSEEVIGKLVPHVGVILKYLNNDRVITIDNVDQCTLDISRGLLKCMAQLSMGYNWRLQTNFIMQLECLVTCMPANFIHQHFNQVLLDYIMETRAKPVRSQLSRTLLVFLRNNDNKNQQSWIRDNLITKLCQAKCSYTRHIYIKMCVHAMDIFSDRYFKRYFFEPLLSLSGDRVSNIRLCIVNLLPTLSRMLIMPQDRSMKTSLENAVSKMQIVEKKKDVIDTLQVYLDAIRSPSVLSAEYLKQQRKRQEEELRIVQSKGSSITLVQSPPQGKRTSILTTRPVSAPNRNPSIDTRSGNLRSDMRFLEQHFYIDAGISLPRDTMNVDVDVVSREFSLCAITDDVKEISLNLDGVATVSVENIDMTSMTENDLKKLEISTTNITDDVKVNLRKITNSKLMPLKVTTNNGQTGDQTQKKSKRHSSIISVSCLDNNQSASSSQNRKTLNRRSLNIVGEISKIPISLNKLRTVTSSLDKNQMKDNKEKKMPSLLKDDNGANVDNSNNANSLIQNSIKNNVPIKASIKENLPKSSLPVLKSRRPTSSDRK